MYDCIVIGGGIAGLQAAIQLGRYRHKVLVIDKGRGRSTLCRNYRNILGWPEGVSGPELRRRGRMQAERLGIEFVQGEVVAAAKEGNTFEVMLDGGAGAYRSSLLLAATGITDRCPELPGLERCLGETVYVCPDCDGYETRGKRTIVMGSGNTGSGMAIALSYWTDRIVYVNHDSQAIGSANLDKLRELGIEYIEAEIDRVITDAEEPLGGQEPVPKSEDPDRSGREHPLLPGSAFRGVQLKNGRIVEGECGFIAFGGNKVHSDLFRSLGVERLENGHIVSDPRSKRTNVPGLWAAGDVGVHAEQVTVAMGEGALAAIWMHKELLARSRNRSAKEAEALPAR